MELSKVLKLESIRTGLEGGSKTKAQVIHEMVDVMADSFDLDKEQKVAVEETILDREAQKSTGMENNVAIPHGKTGQIKGLMAVLGIYTPAIDYGTLDNKPVNFVICIVSDFENSKEQLQTLAQIMRIFNGEDVNRDILRANQAKDVMDILKREEKALRRGRAGSNLRLEA